MSIFPQAKRDLRAAHGRWAPGNYINDCYRCGDLFSGEKRSHMCADCAYAPVTSKKEPILPRPKLRPDGWPTRSSVQHMSPAELAIRDAMLVVEDAGASLALTDAVTLLGKAQERVADHMEGNGNPEDQITTFLSGVVGVVEANSYEARCLWQECQSRYLWIQDSKGLFETIGHIGDMPVCVSLFIVEVDRHKILFVEATSQVVDHHMIDKWLAEKLPRTAFRDGGEYVNKVDAQNFHNVLPRAERAPS
jgi:hypothetical protein